MIYLKNNCSWPIWKTAIFIGERKRNKKRGLGFQMPMRNKGELKQGMQRVLKGCFKRPNLRVAAEKERLRGVNDRPQWL